MPYIGRGPGFGVRSRFIYTATANQTSFSGNDDAGILNVRCDRNNGTGADFTHVEAIICGDLA